MRAVSFSAHWSTTGEAQKTCQINDVGPLDLTVRPIRVMSSAMKAVWLLLVGACGSSTSPHLGPTDSATIDTSLATTETLCGNPLPATAVPVISIRGSVGIYPDVVNLSGTVVEVWQAGASTALASETLGFVSSFDISVPTNGIPIPGYLRAARGGGFVDGYWYPATAYTGSDDNAQLPIMYSPESYSLFADGSTHPDRAVIDLLFSDCDGEDIYSASPIYNVSVTVSPMLPTSLIRYSANGAEWKAAPDTTTTIVRIETDPGPIAIAAATPTRALRTTQIDARANMWANVEVKPQ